MVTLISVQLVSIQLFGIKLVVGNSGIMHQLPQLPQPLTRMIGGLGLLLGLGLTLGIPAPPLGGAIAIAKPAPPLPALTPREIRAIRVQANQTIETSLGIAGVGKSGSPPAIAPELTAYRRQWSQRDAAIAPFLGQWVWDWDTFPPYYQLTIFPSAVKGRVCLVKTGTQLVDANPVPKEVPIAPTFAIVQIKGRQGTSSQMRLSRELIFSQGSFKGTIEWMVVAGAKTQHQVYASKAVPRLDPTWPAAIQTQFKQNQCQG